MIVEDILKKDTFEIDDIVALLSSANEDKMLLFAKAAEVKREQVGDTVYLRGLIEFSNLCSKNCYYCGIRKDNSHIVRYNIDDDDIIDRAKYAFQKKYGSVVLQSGERQDIKFVDKVDRIIKEIKDFSMTDIGITLSCGEQKPETYERWYRSGAHRYMLNIETTNEFVFQKMHPESYEHDFETRKRCLENLLDLGYQTGTGVMIGLPYQNLEDIACDLKFMQAMDVDICELLPYIEHSKTPIFAMQEMLWSHQERFDLSLKCIAVMRILMKNINIVASNSLQAINEAGIGKAIMVGANIVTPNITPEKFSDAFSIYDQHTNLSFKNWMTNFDTQMKIAGTSVGYSEWGDSKHYSSKDRKRKRR